MEAGGRFTETWEQFEFAAKGFCGSEKLGSQALRGGPAEQWGQEEGSILRSGDGVLDSVLGKWELEGDPLAKAEPENFQGLSRDSSQGDH